MKYFKRKFIQKAKEAAKQVTPSISIINCVGSEKKPDCRLPTFVTLEQRDIQQNIVTKLIENDNAEDRKLGLELLEICFFCFAEHEKVRPHISKVALKMMGAVRKAASKMSV